MTDALAISGLTAGYGRRVVVNRLDLAPVSPGTVLSLLGPNAAGKTTLLRALAGLHPATGSVRLGERGLLSLSLADHARLVTYMPQSLPQRVALTVLEGVIGAMRASAPGGQLVPERDVADRALSVIERVGIGHLAMTELSHLSGGQRQLASLAQALVRQPRVLLLDEPISALDLYYQLRVMKLVRELAAESRMIVVMVLHDLAIAVRWSDRVVLLADGRLIADGTPQDAITAAALADVYKVAARVDITPDGVRIAIDDIL
ncbi:ABC transporter ATP-binding protein [Sphingomonas flavalba]|uniref:ABC transporter ATP-binding protein n=1 Tax=Sphingomonas flavalba TaxID=2559804 RepID=UPI0039DFB9E4